MNRNAIQQYEDRVWLRTMFYDLRHLEFSSVDEASNHVLELATRHADELRDMFAEGVCQGIWYYIGLHNAPVVVFCASTMQRFDSENWQEVKL